MKKLLLLLAGILVLSGTALADCGTCETAAPVKKKAPCELKETKACGANSKKASCVKAKKAKAKKACGTSCAKQSVAVEEKSFLKKMKFWRK